MTLREQLAFHVAAIRAGWALMPPPAVPRIGEVSLECRLAVLPMAVIRGAMGRVNAAEIGGAGAGYLLFRGVTTEPVSAVGGPAFRVIVRASYRERPWVGAAVDFGALLDALEPGAPPDAPPEREETWRDRPPLL